MSIRRSLFITKKEFNMVTSGISMGNNWFSQLNQAGNTNQSCSAGNSNGVSASNNVDPMSAPGGRLLQAISAALSQIGVGSNQTSSTSTISDSSSSSAQDPTQALASFMQDLMAALQSQSSTQGTGTDGDGDNDRSGSVRAGGGHHSNIQADLQSLIQQLSASNGSSSSTSTTTSTTGSSSDTLSSLEQSFQNLVDSLGGSGGSAGLGNFLQAFADNMQNASAVGNVVKTQA